MRLVTCRFGFFDLALQKQSIILNFAQGLDTITDPNQLPFGKFVSLSNSVFLKENSATLASLVKRNGFPAITQLADGATSYVTTYNTNLVAAGNGFRVYSQPTNQWSGIIGSITSYQSAQLSVNSLIRNNFNQTTVDAAAANNLICLAYTESPAVGSVSQNYYKYSIIDANSGQALVQPTQIISSFGTVSYMAKAFAVGSKFAVVFPSVASGSAKLQYILFDQNNINSVSAIRDVTASYQPSTIGSTGSFDGVVASNTLFLGWNSNAAGGVKVTSFDSTFTQGTVSAISSVSTINYISMCADTSSQGALTVWASYNTGTAASAIYTTAFDDHQILKGATTAAGSFLASAISNWSIYGRCYTYVETPLTYSYDATIPDRQINMILSEPGFGSTVLSSLGNSIGLASKPFLVGSQAFFLANHYSTYQPSYFLVNSMCGFVGRLAYGNSGMVYQTATATSFVASNVQSNPPSVFTIGSSYGFPYLVKTNITSVNKGTNLSSTTQVAGIYSQVGINAARFTFDQTKTYTSEAASNLHLSGGHLWMYDGNYPVEHGFNLYPENLEAFPSAASGNMASQAYFYIAIYKWVDRAGNIHKSAPSIPYSFNLVGSTSVSVWVPTLRLTNKIQTPPTVAIYRWSQNQQVYYKVAEVTPTSINGLFGAGSFSVVNAYQFTDTFSDNQILGNEALYTNGGVVENIAAPATSALVQFDSRIWLIDSEDPNVLWYSQPIVENTPVEFSDLLTYFVPQNLASQTSTGPIRAIGAMDDKLIVFKKNSIFYINGTGPDLTGANSQYSQPIFIAGSIGCTNQASIVLIPNGLMFQSDKGIWLLGRDLSVSYVGKDVQSYNASTITSAQLIPGTNQVRFVLDSGIVLMYDYLVQQWGTFNISAKSSCVFGNLHTLLDSNNNVIQESIGTYSDVGGPVVQSWQTGWINLAGLSGYQRSYRMYVLGQFKSPHTYTMGIGYDYDAGVHQLATVNPMNVVGSGTSVEQWQINFAQQQCESFQLTFTEVSSQSAGAGLTISGINLVYGGKKSRPQNIPPSNRTG